MIYLIAIAIALAGCKSRHTAPLEGFGNEDQVLRISSASEPETLDPRKARDLPTVTILNMLYEGLLRLNFSGKPTPGIAESYALSSDQKKYTFKLRKCKWSNGDPITAGDFVRSWKEVLDPLFPAPNAYQLYAIKGAKAAKEGKDSLDNVGIKAIDSQTLEVELETPLAYFTELVCSFFYYPVHSNFSSGNLITNGPFKVRAWKRQSELIVERNENYWDVSEVKLDGIIIQILDEQTALRMYENGEIDWAGSPMGTLPQDSILTLTHQHTLRITNAAGTHWFQFNISKKPFDNEKMRKAFTLALNRKAIVEHVTQGGQKPAEGIVPPSLGLRSKPYFEDNDVPKAFEALQEALKETDTSIDDLPPISLCYISNDRNNKIAQAVQQQWKKTLGISVQLENCESQVFFENRKNSNFQMAMGSWYADFHDPINFLELFKSKNNPTNGTNWEDSSYQNLLDESSKELDPSKRFKLLQQAEALLMRQLPVAPLFFGVFNYVKDDNLLGVYFSDLGYLDFKYAFFGD